MTTDLPLPDRSAADEAAEWLPDGLVAVTAPGLIESVNAVALRITGLTREQGVAVGVGRPDPRLGVTPEGLETLRAAAGRHRAAMEESARAVRDLAVGRHAWMQLAYAVGGPVEVGAFAARLLGL